MSTSAPGLAAFSAVYRIVSPTVNVKHGALSANAKFVTNVPFDYAIFIYDIRWGIAIKDPPGSAANDWQITAELTENVSATTASNTDPVMIADTFYEERVVQVSAASEIWTWRNPFDDDYTNFVNEIGAPYASVAQNFNVVATMVELVGSGPATNGVDVFANIRYTIAPVTSALRDYLAKRLQIQG